MANSNNGIPSGRQGQPPPAAALGHPPVSLAVQENEALRPAVELLRPLLREPKEASQAVVRIAAQLFRGPLPPPEQFKAYEDLVEGSARTILGMAVTEQSHRHRMQTLEMLYPYLGWFAGFAGFLACVGGAVYLGMYDHEKVALALLGLPVAGVIGWFIRSRAPSATASQLSAPTTRPKPSPVRRSQRGRS